MAPVALKKFRGLVLKDAKELVSSASNNAWNADSIFSADYQRIEE